MHSLFSKSSWQLKISILFVVYFTLSIFFSHTAVIEPFDYAAIRRFLFPNMPVGALVYDPFFHYNVVFGLLAKASGTELNLGYLANIQWLTDALMTVATIGIFSLLAVREKRHVVVLLLGLSYLMNRSVEVDQKTFLYFTSSLMLYFFMTGNTFMLSVTTAFLFYIHVGLGIWWLGSLCVPLFAETCLSRFKKSDFWKYVGLCLVLVLPIFYIYITKVTAMPMTPFVAKYFLYECWYCSSVRLSWNYAPVQLLFKLSKVFFCVCLVWATVQARESRVKLIGLSVAFLAFFAISGLGVDILGMPTVAATQPLRSILITDIVASHLIALYVAGLGGISLYVLFGLTAWVYISGPMHASVIPQEGFLIGLYAIVLAHALWGRRLRPIFSQVHRVSWPTFWPIILIALWFMWPNANIIRNYRQLSAHNPNPPSYKSVPFEDTKNRWVAIYMDLLGVVNHVLKGDAVVAVPFDFSDIMFYSEKKIFINIYTPTYQFVLRDAEFPLEKILFEDLGLSPNDFFSDKSNIISGTWMKAWDKVTEDHLRLWKKLYRTDYVIRENGLPFNFPVIHRNALYTLYRVE